MQMMMRIELRPGCNGRQLLSGGGWGHTRLIAGVIVGAGTGLGVGDDADSGKDGAEHRGRGQPGAGVEDRHGLQAA